VAFATPDDRLAPVTEPVRAAARVDLGAISANVARLADAATGSQVMAVVKAEGYGHGMVPVARAALSGGATWLAVAFADEALALRAAGIGSPVLALLATPGDDLEALVRDGVDIGVSDTERLAAAADAGAACGRPTRVHLKADTGLGRAGAPVADWPHLVDAAAKAEAVGTVRVAGLWSHFAYADAPGHSTVRRQQAVFAEALDVADRAGLRPDVRHLANSAATLTAPATHYDLVRPGIAVYGLSPGPDVGTQRDLGLRPAMTVSGRVALTKRVPTGQGVSYGHRYTTERETTLALIPLGYADGVPRHATNACDVLLAGRRRRIAGTVCMDQFVLDVGDDPVAAGDDAVLFGPGDHGEPTADDWAEVLGTIGYEIVARIGPRVPRIYVTNGPER
jgi:alanine racemase